MFIGEATCAGISDRVDVEPLGEWSPKGKSRPVAAYVLREVNEGPDG